MKAIKIDGTTYVMEDLKNGNKRLIKLDYVSFKITDILESCTDEELFEENYRRALKRGEYD